MQGLKDLVSVKSTDRRLPPLRRSSNLAATNQPALPSISGSLTQAPLPGISSNNGVNSPRLQPETSSNVTEQERSHEPIPLNNISRRNDSGMATVSVNSPTTALFQTSTTSGGTSQPISEAMEAASRVLAAKEELRRKLEQKGIRTWPVLAVLSVFFCNPIVGFLAAVLTLKAENSYFEGHLIDAQLESRVAKLLLIIAIVTGCVAILGIIIWVSVKCTSDDGCPR